MSLNSDNLIKSLLDSLASFDASIKRNIKSEMIDVVALSPAPQPTTSSADCTETSLELTMTGDEGGTPLASNNEKAYYCQRCLNHDLQIPRKGHKKNCLYLFCECQNCVLVEKRRVLNNMLSKKMLGQSGVKPTLTASGKKIRDPKCARCAAHGVSRPLRGHKKSQCAFANCECSSCKLVESRRGLMARQIRLRRIQQKQRLAGEIGNSPTGSASPPAITAVLPLPAPTSAKDPMPTLSSVTSTISSVDVRIPMPIPSSSITVPSTSSTLSSTIPSPSSLSCSSPLIENRPQLSLSAFGFPTSSVAALANALNSSSATAGPIGILLPNACNPLSSGGNGASLAAPVPLMPLVSTQLSAMPMFALVPISPGCQGPLFINPLMLSNFS